jgi:hypothetical protein
VPELELDDDALDAVEEELLDAAAAPEPPAPVSSLPQAPREDNAKNETAVRTQGRND